MLTYRCPCGTIVEAPAYPEIPACPACGTHPAGKRLAARAKRAAASVLHVPKLTETQFQNQILQTAKALGWRTAHFRPGMNRRGQWQTAVSGDGKGFPDLVLARDRIIFVELKAQGKNLEPEQIIWRDALQAAGCEYHLWRPSDLDAATAILKERLRK